MSRPTVPTCDECGAQKKETNHWWELTTYTIDMLPPERHLELMEFSERRTIDQINQKDSTLDLCSEQCVTRAIGKWMRGELK